MELKSHNISTSVKVVVVRFAKIAEEKMLGINNMIKLFLIKTLTGFEVSKTSYGEFNKLKIGEEVKAKVTSPSKRVLGFHKKYFSLLDVAFENKPEYLDGMNKEHFRKEIIARAGFYDTHTNFKGLPIYEAKSISFVKMDQKTFEDLYDRSMDIIIQYVLNGSKSEEIEREVLAKLNGF